MNKSIIVLIVIFLVGAAVMFLRGNEDAWICDNGQWVKHGNPSAPMPIESCPGAENNEKIKVEKPKVNDVVSSPLKIKGEARGMWFFEASFPIKIFDSEGNLLAIGNAEAKDDWMTEEFVPFEAELSFTVPVQGNGILVLERDNPSGLPENDEEIRIPVKFPETLTMAIKAYFNNSQLDPEASCNKVFAVERMVPKTQAVARAALEELLKGPTENEKEQGFFTSINPGVKIQKLVIQDGRAEVDFDEQMEFQMGGSCRVSAIRAEITETMKQFSNINEVIISVDGRTEDILQP